LKWQIVGGIFGLGGGVRGCSGLICCMMIVGCGQGWIWWRGIPSTVKTSPSSACIKLLATILSALAPLILSTVSQQTLQVLVKDPHHVKRTTSRKTKVIAIIMPIAVSFNIIDD
jgi:hypothetical protein